jgi:hypothetical protein
LSRWKRRAKIGLIGFAVASLAMLMAFVGSTSLQDRLMTRVAEQTLS